MPFLFTVYADEYTFGNGWKVGDSPLTLGGYISSDYVSQHESSYVDIDDIAFLAYGEFERFDFLAEFEIADFYKKETNGASHESMGELHIERFYGDYFFADNQRLRIGKFNSDIGFWNQIPINVLRDTTSNPRLVDDFFPKLTTGINYEIRPSNGVINRVSFTIQHNKDIDQRYNNFILDHHYSFAADSNINDLFYRISGGDFQYENAHQVVYLLGALKLDRQQWSTILESVIRHDQIDETSASLLKDKFSYDLYAQGTWHWEPKHDSIVRLEIEKIPLIGKHDKSIVVGYTYRPLDNVALKGEYEGHEDTLLNRWLFSFSVLF